jgi:uncharacterized membrane protein YhaH (DUF805 family)
VLVVFGIVILAVLLDAAMGDAGTGLAGLLYGVFVLGAIIPSLALAVRRLHDLDRSGWMLLMWFVPVYGVILLLLWDCTRGSEGPNRFGKDPLG